MVSTMVHRTMILCSGVLKIPIRSGIYREYFITGGHARDLQLTAQRINPILWMQVQKR